MNKIHFQVKDITTGEIVKDFEFDSTSISYMLDKDIQNAKQNYLELIKKRYPPDKYQILERTEEIPIEINDKFKMEASEKSLRIVNCSGIILGGILVFILLTLRHSYSFGYFIFAIVIILSYMIGDYLIWKKRGIRAIEVDASGINLYRGPNKRFERIEASQITDINVFTKVNRRVVTILTGGQVYQAPGITLFKGPKIRITDDSFDNKQFTIFIEKIKRFEK